MTGKFVRSIETDIIKEISLKYFLAHLNKSQALAITWPPSLFFYILIFSSGTTGSIIKLFINITQLYL